MKFGEKLRKLRTELSMTQNEVATSVGISLRTYASYEQEGRYPRKRELYKKLADILGCEVNYLLTEDEEIVSKDTDQYRNRAKRQAKHLVAELCDMFARDELSDTDKDAVMIALQKAYFDCKKDNKDCTNNRCRQWT